MILDSMDFENEDIIITDPQDIVTGRDNWEDCCEYRRNNGRNDITDALKKLGFKKVISNSAIIGDRVHKVFKIDVDGKKIKIGEFNLYSRLVAVFSLDEVKKYNPDYNYKYYETVSCAAIIRNYTGRVSIKYLPDGKTSIVGHGNVNFYSENLDWRGSMAREYEELNIPKIQSSVAFMQILLTCKDFGLSKEQMEMMTNLCIDYAEEVAKEVATRTVNETWKALKAEAEKRQNDVKYNKS